MFLGIGDGVAQLGALLFVGGGLWRLGEQPGLVLDGKVGNLKVWGVLFGDAKHFAAEDDLRPGVQVDRLARSDEGLGMVGVDRQKEATVEL